MSFQIFEEDTLKAGSLHLIIPGQNNEIQVQHIESIKSPACRIVKSLATVIGDISIPQDEMGSSIILVLHVPI